MSHFHVPQVAVDKYREDELLKVCVALIGDLVSNLKQHCTQYVHHPSIVDMLREANAKKIVEAMYASEVIGKFTS